MVTDLNKKLLELKRQIIRHFNSDHWIDIAMLTDSVSLIQNHSRLLRSLSFGDGDYDGHVSQVLLDIANRDASNIDRIIEYVGLQFGDSSNFISEKPSNQLITFAPSVFSIPDVEQRIDLVAVMMPFKGFDNVFATIGDACEDAGSVCLRADNIWEESTFIQDIFNLIFQARIVVCDFTEKNANVFYETGIAHTLGKEVIPIAQSLNDIPSDLQHHRALQYLPNSEGLDVLRKELCSRIMTIKDRT